MHSEYAKARADDIHEQALHYAERHPQADHPVETRSEHMLKRLLAAIRWRRASK